MAQVFFTQERRITVDLNYIRIVVHLEGQGKWDLLVWYFVHFILLPSSAWFGFLEFWMRVGRGVFIAPIAVCHIARARPGIFEILGRHRKEVVKGGWMGVGRDRTAGGREPEELEEPEVPRWLTNQTQRGSK